MVVSFIRKINGAIFWLALTIFDNVMLLIDMLFHTKKGTNYSAEDVYRIKKENRRIITDFFCQKRKKVKARRDPYKFDGPSDSNPRPQNRGNDDSDDSDDDRPQYQPRRQQMHSFRDYGSTDGSGACSLGGG